MQVETLLEDLGFEDVHWANSLVVAERDLAARTPSFAVLDINVGLKLDFSRGCGIAARAVAFVFSSGRSRELMPAAWAHHPFIAKPLTREALANLVRILLAQAQSA